MGELNFCTLADIIKYAHDGLILDLSLDRNLPYLVSRLLHNKLWAYLMSGLRCYFLYFDLWQISKFVFLLFIPFVIYAFIDGRYRKYLLTVQFFFPLLFILNPLHLTLGQRINVFGIYYTVLGIFGVIKLLTRKKTG